MSSFNLKRRPAIFASADTEPCITKPVNRDGGKNDLFTTKCLNHKVGKFFALNQGDWTIARPEPLHRVTGQAPSNHVLKMHGCARLCAKPAKVKIEPNPVGGHNYWPTPTAPLVIKGRAVVSPCAPPL